MPAQERQQNGIAGAPAAGSWPAIEYHPVSAMSPEHRRVPLSDTQGAQQGVGRTEYCLDRGEHQRGCREEERRDRCPPRPQSQKPETRPDHE